MTDEDECVAPMLQEIPPRPERAAILRVEHPGVPVPGQG
jgi:hypothetical protein